MGRNTGLDPSELYPHDVFIWIPNLLPGAPDRFKCTCGKVLSRNGWNDDPIARRVRSIPADFFLLTNRFVCNPRQQTLLLSRIPDGELDLSSATLNVPISFDLMSGHPVEGDDAFNALTSFDMPNGHPLEVDPLDDLIEWEASLNPAVPEIPLIPPPVLPSILPLRQIERQMQLPGAPAPVPQVFRKEKRCAPCVKNYCRRRHECNGRGGKDLCNCVPSHPKMAKGERARISEEVIEAYLAQTN
ncbi:hypothetical protein K438DRAFT_268271 [Mycena galopus ATCC 62051]|nr:hypothetical protein K438DRAFT_268271 [Mycena galopus ATCC 62051]